MLTEDEIGEIILEQPSSKEEVLGVLEVTSITEENTPERFDREGFLNSIQNFFFLCTDREGDQDHTGKFTYYTLLKTSILIRVENEPINIMLV